MESSDTNNDKLTTLCMTMDHAVENERLRYERYHLETGTATAPTTQTRLLDPDPETIGFYNQRMITFFATASGLIIDSVRSTDT